MLSINCFSNTETHHPQKTNRNSYDLILARPTSLLPFFLVSYFNFVKIRVIKSKLCERKRKRRTNGSFTETEWKWNNSSVHFFDFSGFLQEVWNCDALLNALVKTYWNMHKRANQPFNWNFSVPNNHFSSFHNIFELIAVISVLGRSKLCRG